MESKLNELLTLLGENMLWLSQPVYQSRWFIVTVAGFAGMLGVLIAVACVAAKRRKTLGKQLEALRARIPKPEEVQENQQLLLDEIRRTEKRLDSLHAEVRALKAELDAARVSREAEDIPRTVPQWETLIQRALRQSTLPDESLTNALRNTPNVQVISFADIKAYQQNNGYDVFAAHNRGACLMLPLPGRENEFAGFPYPRSSTWFEEERDALAKIFQFLGESRSPRPRAQLQKPAVLMRVDNPIGPAEHYRVKEKGALYLTD